MLRAATELKTGFVEVWEKRAAWRVSRGMATNMGYCSIIVIYFQEHSVVRIRAIRMRAFERAGWNTRVVENERSLGCSEQCRAMPG
jgi:hypothetical protein